MKPLSTKQQIEVLKELLSTGWNICGMCPILHNILKKYEIKSYENIFKYIPSFTYYNYITFYSSVKAVQERRCSGYWDSFTFFGNLRRRWFIRHLIKELKKQL